MKNLPFFEIYRIKVKSKNIVEINELMVTIFNIQFLVLNFF